MTQRTFSERKEFARSLNVEALTQKIAEALGYPDIVFHSKIETRESNEEVGIRFTSENIKDKCGLFGNLCETVTVENWHGFVRQDNETGNMCIFWSIKLSYQFLTGGKNTNDTGIDAWYEENKGFTIRNVENKIIWEGGNYGN